MSFNNLNSNTNGKSSTTNNSNNNFTTTILTPQELSTHPTLLDQIQEIVNQAYLGTHLKLENDLGFKPHSIFPGLRFRSRNQLVEELSSYKDSLIAIMFDESRSGPSLSDSVEYTSGSASSGSGASTTNHIEQQQQQQSDDSNAAAAATSTNKSKKQENDKKKIVAIASIKRWKGSVLKRHYQSLSSEASSSTSSSPAFPVGSQYPPPSILSDTLITDPEPEKYLEWEIATCASVNDVQYRGKGLISRLNAILLAELQKKFNDNYNNTSKERKTTQLNDDSSAIQDENNDETQLPIRLWVSALGGSINKDYWIKRGYTVLGDKADVAPPGVWGNAADVQIWTLNKVVS